MSKPDVDSNFSSLLFNSLIVLSITGHDNIAPPGIGRSPKIAGPRMLAVLLPVDRKTLRRCSSNNFPMSGISAKAIARSSISNLHSLRSAKVSVFSGFGDSSDSIVPPRIIAPHRFFLDSRSIVARLMVNSIIGIVCIFLGTHVRYYVGKETLYSKIIANFDKRTWFLCYWFMVGG